jgi:hypothetical protein
LRFDSPDEASLNEISRADRNLRKLFARNRLRLLFCIATII